MTDYRRLTVRSIFRLVKLKVSKLQRDLVAPNAITIAQSLFEKGSEISAACGQLRTDIIG